MRIFLKYSKRGVPILKIWFEKYKTLFIGIFVVVLAFFLFIIQPRNNQTYTEGSLLMTEIDGDKQLEDIPFKDEAIIEHVFVDLKGAVRNPGIYEAKEGERVFDIVERSGGLLEIADENQVNFAEGIVDEMVIYIPQIGEETDSTFTTNASQTTKNEKVNLNKADSAQLETLPGIGPAKAAAIIEYRETNGPFKETAELQKVSGFGMKTFERLEELISVR